MVGTGKGKRERRDHTLTVKAVKEAEGKWEVDAVDGQSVHLELHRATVLRGETRGRSTGSSQGVRLEKPAP